MPLILGIETSCDETAAAVVRDGTQTLSSIVASQIDLHALYGGVVPELASREHLRNIVPVVREALSRARVTLHDLDAIAVTSGPGLSGALLVGLTYAKSLAFALGIPLLPVNHLEGHIYAVLMEHSATLLAAEHPGPGAAQPGPLVALVVSGGHTHLYRADPVPHTSTLAYQLLGRTVDDAAGEAFDKVAKLLGLPYPGGPWIDALAPLGNPRAIPFRFSPIKPARESVIPTESAAAVEGPAFRPQPSNPPPSLDLSFSGIKTAVLRHLQTNNLLAEAELRRQNLPQTARPNPDLITQLRRDGVLPPHLLDLAASFQYAVVGRLLQQTLAAAEQTTASALLVTGGVAANRELRARFSAEAARRHLPIAFPTLALSTDNAAMIAAAAFPRLLTGNLPAPETSTDSLTAAPQLRLETPA